LVFGTAIGLTNVVIARKMELKFIFKAVNQFVPIMAGILSLLAIRRGIARHICHCSQLLLKFFLTELLKMSFYCTNSWRIWLIPFL
jgi:hypothetical protein